MPSSAWYDTSRARHPFPTRRSSDLGEANMTLNQKKATRSGTVAVHLAVCLVAILSVLAFSLDGGILLAQRRQIQAAADASALAAAARSEEHTSELQSLRHLVCRLLPGTTPLGLDTLSLHDALPI